MRKLLTLMVAVCGLLLTACETENSAKKGEIIINSGTNVEIGLYAGEFVIDYEIKGITDVDATITTTADWLRVAKNERGMATIQYETNNSGGTRQAAIMLGWDWSKATVVVTQSNEAIAPILTLLGEDNIELDRCGQKVVISYKLENTNPVDYVYAKTSADWIYSIECKGGKVTLGVATHTAG